MADCIHNPESARMASAWKRQLHRLETSIRGAASVTERYPAGAFGSPENDLREVMIDAASKLVFEEARDLMAVPAPDLAGVVRKLEAIAAEHVDSAPEDIAVCIDDLRRLIEAESSIQKKPD